MTRLIFLLSAVGVIAACTSESDQWNGFLGDKLVWHVEQMTYVECLAISMRSGTELSADEIRSLCEEIAGVGDELWKYEDGSDELVPGNDYTACFSKESEELKDLGKARAARLAKLSCKYPEYE